MSTHTYYHTHMFPHTKMYYIYYIVYLKGELKLHVHRRILARQLPRLLLQAVDTMPRAEEEAFCVAYDVTNSGMRTHIY
jgi:hypothetical protein